MKPTREILERAGKDWIIELDLYLVCGLVPIELSCTFLYNIAWNTIRSVGFDRPTKK